MAVDRKTKTYRVTKQAVAPRKNWSEAIKQGLVQSHHVKHPSQHGACAELSRSAHNIALQEALKCTECENLHINRHMMEADITARAYIVSEYPPFFSCESVQDDNIDPLDTSPPPNKNATFWDDITLSQQQKYYDAIDTLIKKAERDSGKPADETTVLFAHYEVDFHIRQHYLRPRSLLTLCRSKEDIKDLNYWHWENAVSDELASGVSPEYGVGWVHEPSNSIGHQIEAWEKGARLREEHLAEVREQWAKIMEERRKQRLRKVTFLFQGVPIREYSYESPCEPPLTEEEIVCSAARLAGWV
ncbi:uncharacterized protein N7515_000788 [Penicillium bovifimosum]|uniref:Uncharacterized protein n=1 Tax=Penicillium bovifimosum TaxID=126998 RepID=A0A9W9HGP9_9EURO|nr:uncharacterized protein N7515_000788 [Penicillium bovifimosum]KAJ5146224.1 hypothetical protein N7515_000788 [Penicillium bovifimosum]